MPRKPKRPCSYPGCPELTEDSYCKKHKRKWINNIININGIQILIKDTVEPGKESGIDVLKDILIKAKIKMSKSAKITMYKIT